MWCYDFKKMEESEFKGQGRIAKYIGKDQSYIFKFIKRNSDNFEEKLLLKRYMITENKATRGQKIFGYSKYIEANNDIELEFWKKVKKFDIEGLEISSLGRLRVNLNENYKYKKPYLWKNKTKTQKRLRYKIDKKDYDVSGLMKEYFFEEKGGYVYYINGDVCDNRIKNLEVISKSEHGKRTGHRSKSRMVCKINKETDEIVAIYRSAREAGRENFCSYQTILDNISGKYKNGVICIEFKYKWFDEVDITRS